MAYKVPYGSANWPKYKMGLHPAAHAWFYENTVSQSPKTPDTEQQNCTYEWIAQQTVRWW
jgi:hypothetical protein